MIAFTSAGYLVLSSEKDMKEKKLLGILNVILIKNELLFYIMISDHYDIMTQNYEWQIHGESPLFPI